MRATLVIDHRMNLIDDQRMGRAQNSAAAFAGQQDIERFRCGNNDMWRLLGHRQAIFRRRVTCSYQRTNLDASDAHRLEILLNPAQWFLQTDIPPAEQRGAYVAANRMMLSAGQTVAPAGLTLLAIQTGGWGWWVIAGIFVACAFTAQPAVAWVARTRRVEDLASIGA